MRNHNQNIILIFFFCIFSAFSALGYEPRPVPSYEELKKKSRHELFNLASDYANSNFELSEKILNVAIENAIASKVSVDIKECYRAYGFLFEDARNFKAAILQYQKALNVENIPLNQKSFIYNDIGIAFREAGNYQESINHHRLAIEAAENSKDIEALEQAYDGFASLNYLIGNYDKAVEYYLKSMDYAQKRPNNTLGTIISLRNLTEVYTLSKNHDLALQSANKALQLANTLKDTTAITNVLLTYSNALNEIGQYDKALNYINQALSFLTTDGNKEERLLAYSKLGEIYLKLNDENKGTYYYDICLADKEFLSPSELSKILSDLGLQKIIHKDYVQGKKYLMESIAIAEQYHLTPIKQKNHIQLYSLYKAQNNLTEALSHLEKAKNLKDSLQVDEKNKQIVELQLRYDFEKSENEIKSLKYRAQNLFTRGSAFVVILVVAFLSFLIWIKGKNNKSLEKINEEKFLQNKKLEESNKVLSEFAYASAHDLKEPLRNISGFVSLIRRRYGANMADEANEYMDFVVGAVKKMNVLLDDLLTFSNVIIGKDTNVETVAIKDVILDVISTYNSEILAHNVKISANIDSSIRLHVSKLHLTQLLQNLIGNAIKFVDDKCAIIKVETLVQANSVLISVKDNGIGISKEYGDKIFQLFQRLNKKDNRYEGSGVGLAICKNIVEKYNGKIWFESVENEGTTFFVEFPK